MSGAIASIEAEQSVLGAIMLDARVFDAVSSTLTPGCFHASKHGAIYEALGALASAGKPCDVVSLWDELGRRGTQEEGGLGYINALAESVHTSRHAKRHAEIVAEKAAARAVLAAVDEAYEVAESSDSIQVKLDRIGSLFAALERTGGTRDPRRVGDLALQRTQHYEDVAAGRVQSGMRTGLQHMDDLLGGGLKAGHLMILAARPGIGKSSFAMELAQGVALRGYPVLFLSQEMPEEEVADRAIVRAGQVNYSNVQRGTFEGDDWSRITEGVESLRGMELYVDDQPAMSLLDIRSKARRVKGVKVIVLDYLQLCDAPEGENRNQQIGKISRGLKALAKQLGACVIALSQLNRGVENRSDKRPKSSDLRDSGEIEQDADEIAFLWPLADDQGKDVRAIGFALDKVRGGRAGSGVLNFEGSRQRWTESTQRLDDYQPTKTARKGGFE